MTVTDTLRDAAYVTVGFGVLGFQKAQVRRHELARRLEGPYLEAHSQLVGQVTEGREALTAVASQLDELVAPVRTQMAAGLNTIEATLPPVVAEVIEHTRRAMHGPEQALRACLGLDPGSAPA